MPRREPVAILELEFESHVYFEGMTDLLEDVNKLPSVEGFRFDDDIPQEREYYGNTYVVEIYRSDSDVQSLLTTKQSWFARGLRCNFDGDESALEHAKLFAEMVRAYFVHEPAHRHNRR